ncbi:MAG: ABC transporter ATP-binding protein [Thermoplasmata archaeon]|nr:ABC transporter ATP-binding protein [Thermoplasmata archaeon]MCJ7562212.1 ABC transporter ATP-binding protein [Thermoplasmata archaeon]TFG70129.1 MAG: ABC transporter ATP-binding protein [Methanomassiliicoccus sp.]
MAVIDAKDLVMDFGGMKALNLVSLTVEKGDLYGFFGPNGAGKTTLIRILTGQLKPTSGTVDVLRVDVVKNPIKAKELVGIVPEVESPPTYLTAYEYLYFVGKVRKVDNLEDRIDKWLSFFDLESKKGTICKDMSKGMRQKLMLASAFMHEPELLLLDEPFINLDPIYQKLLREHLEEYVSKGGTVFLCSHILEIAERLCNKLAIVNLGRVVVQGRKDELVKEDDDLERLFMRVIGGDTLRRPS